MSKATEKIKKTFDLTNCTWVNDHTVIFCACWRYCKGPLIESSEKKNLFRSLKIPENTQTITLTLSNQAHIQNICLVSNNAFQTAGASIWKIVVFESEINSFFFWQRSIQTKIFSLLWTVWSLFLSGGDQSGRINSSHSAIQEFARFARSDWMGLSGGDQSGRINSSHSIIEELASFTRSDWTGLSGGDQSRRINSSHSIIEELARSDWMGLLGEKNFCSLK